MNENVEERLAELIQELTTHQTVSGRDKALLDDLKELKETVGELERTQHDSNVKLEILTERFANFITRYEELKEDVEALQDKGIDEASNSRKFREQAILLAIGGIVTYIVQALLSK